MSCVWVGGLHLSCFLLECLDDCDVLLFLSNEKRTKAQKRKDARTVKDRSWVLAKKDRRRRQGLETPRDTKYTGRKRGPKF